MILILDLSSTGPLPGIHSNLGYTVTYNVSHIITINLKACVCV